MSALAADSAPPENLFGGKRSMQMDENALGMEGGCKRDDRNDGGVDYHPLTPPLHHHLGQFIVLLMRVYSEHLRSPADS